MIGRLFLDFARAAAPEPFGIADMVAIAVAIPVGLIAGMILGAQ